MNVYKIKIKELNSVEEIESIHEYVTNELENLLDDMYVEEDINFAAAKKEVIFLRKLLHRLNIRKYELMQPDLSDGTIDLYRDYDAHYTITEHGKKIPIGSIAYHKTKNPIPGNIAYEVKEAYQGHHYALRALRLVGKRLLDSGIQSIFITANNNKNYPSIKTIESFGGILCRGDKNIPGPVAYTCDLNRIYSK